MNCLNRGLVILTFLLPLCGCAGTRSSGGDDAKLKHTPQINEVQVVELKKTDFPFQLISNGKLCAKRKAALSFSTGGVITAVRVSNGQRIAEGTVIAELENSTQKMALESAQLSLKKAELDFLDVVAGQGYSIKDISAVPAEVVDMAKMRSGYYSASNELSRAQIELSRTVLRAPFGGVVADLTLKTWDTVASDAFCTLIDDSSFDVDFSVLESEYGILSKGLEVSVLPFGSEKSFGGSIVSINPSIDRNGQIAVRASVKNTGTLIDGMNVKVKVEKIIPGQLVVPKSAVVIRDNLEVLFRYNNGTSDWVYVNTVSANSESYVIEANEDRHAKIAEGELVIISGNLNLADGSKVQLKDAE